jgi:hypothetical protein
MYAIARLEVAIVLQREEMARRDEETGYGGSEFAANYNVISTTPSFPPA